MKENPAMRILVATLLAAFCSFASAHDYNVGDLNIDHPWARALPPTAPAGAAYFVVHSKSTTDDTLVSAMSPVADKTELHTHVMMGEVMKMQQVESVAIPAGGEVKFAPGGLHVMLFGLKQPLVAGESFPLTLVFQNAGTVQVDVKVEQDAPPAEHSDH
jgi:hypothetical protein